MPRLTSAAYYHAHKQLRHFWLENIGLYANLSSLEQWQLHDYFQPSKDWTKEQLLLHREQITKKRPALPQQAGRAYVKFQAGAASWATAPRPFPQPSEGSGRRQPQTRPTQHHGQGSRKARA